MKQFTTAWKHDSTAVQQLSISEPMQDTTDPMVAAVLRGDRRGLKRAMGSGRRRPPGFVERLSLRHNGS